jgi:hypothetical protein
MRVMFISQEGRKKNDGRRIAEMACRFVDTHARRNTGQEIERARIFVSVSDPFGRRPIF